MADPWQLLTGSQKKAMGLVTEAFERVSEPVIEKAQERANKQ